MTLELNNCCQRPEVPHISFPSKDILVNMTMELGITNLSLAMNDIIETLIKNLPSILASHIIINPNRIEDIRIKYENQTKNSRASAEEIAKEYNNALILLRSTHGNNESCQTIGCLSEDEIVNYLKNLIIQQNGFIFYM